MMIVVIDVAEVMHCRYGGIKCSYMLHGKLVVLNTRFHQACNVAKMTVQSWAAVVLPGV
jgi:hypothetical protein